MTTEGRLRSLLEAGSPDWQKAERGPIAWMIREHGRGAQIGNVLLEEDVDLAVEAVNALPKLLAVVAASRDYLAVDGSGVGDPDPRWAAPFDALELGKARPALRAALAALDEP